MGLSYEYNILPAPESMGTEGVPHQWIVQFDALGGNNGYMADPYAVFNSSQQKVLQIDVEQHDNGGLEIMDTTRLIERKQRPKASKQGLNLWQKLVKFLASGNDEAEDPGHIVFLQLERQSSDKKETFGQKILGTLCFYN